LSIIKEALKLALASDLDTHEVKLKLASMFGVDEKTAAMILINARNELNKPKVKKANRKLLFLPQCLRTKECKAKLTEKGYACVRCRASGRCQIAKIIDAASIPAYVMPGGSAIMNILRHEKPDAIIGVACIPELEEGMYGCQRLGVLAMGINLAIDGCVNTAVDFAEVKKTLREVGALKENGSNGSNGWKK
jgi:hypothetical protein